MNIECPNCGTLFSVPDDALGPNGRTLKCSRCAHVWYQTATPPEPEAASAPHEPEAVATDADGDELSQDDAGSEDTQVTNLDDPMSPGESTLLNVGTTPQDVGDAPQDIFDLNAPDPGGADLENANEDDSAEGVPPMFSSPVPEEKTGWVKRVLIVALVWLAVLGVLGGGLYAFRNDLMQRFPSLESWYRKVGLPISVLGLGLKFQNVTAQHLAVNGDNSLVVRGLIANVSNKKRQLPHLKLALFDGTDTVVQSMVQQPPTMALEAGQVIGFRLMLPNPSSSTRRFVVDWMSLSESR